MLLFAMIITPKLLGFQLKRELWFPCEVLVTGVWRVVDFCRPIPIQELNQFIFYRFVVIHSLIHLNQPHSWPDLSYTVG